MSRIEAIKGICGKLHTRGQRPRKMMNFRKRRVLILGLLLYTNVMTFIGGITGNKGIGAGFFIVSLLIGIIFWRKLMVPIVIDTGED